MATEMERRLLERIKWTRDRWQDVMEDVAEYAQQTLGKPITKVGGLVGGFHAVASNEVAACDAAIKGEGYYAVIEERVMAKTGYAAMGRAWARFAQSAGIAPMTVEFYTKRGYFGGGWEAAIRAAKRNRARKTKERRS